MLFDPLPRLTAIAGLALVFAAGEISAQSQTSKYETWENPDQSASRGSDDPSVQALLDELTALVDEADRARAADPRFIEDLRNLIRGYDWPWRVTILDENFSDGRVAETPRWSILSGEFRAEYGVGLRSVIQARQASQQQSSGDEDDLAAQLLNQLLKQATQGQGTQTKAAPDSALIHVATPIANGFAVDSAISSKQSNGRFEIEVLSTRATRPWLPSGVQPGGASVIGTAAGREPWYRGNRRLLRKRSCSTMPPLMRCNGPVTPAGRWW